MLSSSNGGNMEQKSEKNPVEEGNSLEGESVEDSPSIGVKSPDESNSKETSVKGGGLKRIANRINIYLLLFILIIVLSGIVVFVGMQRAKKDLASPTINTTPLTQETLDQLNNSDATVGDPKQTLSVESNTIFSGTVLIKGGLDVAGAIKIGGTLNIPGISVSGDSSFDQINANGLSIAGNSSIQGDLNIQGSITVAGGAQFGGNVSVPQLSVQSLVLGGDLTITRHIDGGGGTPGRTNGSALGSGGTTSVSGTDTAGTLTVNTGGGPGSGCFATINFTQSFSGTPHIVITPVGSAAAGLNYYIIRSTTSFSICSTNAAPGSSSFSFDWVAID
jgi:hypothetical protein